MVPDVFLIQDESRYKRFVVRVNSKRVEDDPDEVFEDDCAHLEVFKDRLTRHVLALVNMGDLRGEEALDDHGQRKDHDDVLSEVSHEKHRARNHYAQYQTRLPRVKVKFFVERGHMIQQKLNLNDSKGSTNDNEDNKRVMMHISPLATNHRQYNEHNPYITNGK